MSKAVIKEGWINLKSKDKEIFKIYAVLTKSDLKIYQSQNIYKQQPNETMRVVDLREAYNILPISFSNENAFSIFKKGEKSVDRLYLHALNRVDYESWLNFIEGVLKSETRAEAPLANGEDFDRNATVIGDKTSVQKPSINIKNTNSLTSEKLDLKNVQLKNSKSEVELNMKKTDLEKLVKDTEQLKNTLAILESEFNKLKETHNKVLEEKESLKQANVKTETKLNAEIRRLKTEKQRITDKKVELEKDIEVLKKNVKDNIDVDQTQLNQILNGINTKIQSNNINLSSYMYCIDYFSDKIKSSSALEFLLRRQLINLIHRCPIDLNSNVTLLDYLTVNIDLSLESVIQFLAKLLTSLINNISKTSLVQSNLDPNVVSLIKNIVTMTKISQKIDSSLNFSQTVLEIAYLLAKKYNFQETLTNGVSLDECNEINNQFENFLRSYKCEYVEKIMIMELGNHLKEVFKNNSKDKENSTTKDLSNKGNSFLISYFNKKWDETLKELDQKNQEISDLYITIDQLSARIRSLEADSTDSNYTFSCDKFINIYSMNAEILCSTCQSNVVDLFEMPIVEKINAIILDFKSYWKILINVYSLMNTKQQCYSSLREIFEKMIPLIQNFECLMKSFSQITCRKIDYPPMND